MKVLVTSFFVLFVLNVTCTTASHAGSKNSSIYDTGVNVDQMIQNDRILKNYMDCLLDKGKCTKEGQQLKKDLPEAIASDCAKCTEKQKKNVGKILAHLLQNKRHYWEELLAKYDPEGKFRKKYELKQ